MVQQIIDVGTVANDRTGDSWRDAMIKSNANFTELFASGLAVNLFGGYTYDGTAISDTDPGSGVFKLNALDPTTATFLFISKTQDQGPSLANILLTKVANDNLILLDRDNFGQGNAYIVAGDVVNATGYVKIPLTHVSEADTGSIISGNYTVFSTDQNGSIVATAADIQANEDRVNRISITEVVEPGLVTLDNPPSVGFTFSYTAGIARFISEDSVELIVNFPGDTGVAINGGLTSDVIVLTVNTLGQVDQFDDELTPNLRRTTALLAFISREATGELRFAFNPGQIEYQNLNKFFDFMSFLGPITGSAIFLSDRAVADTTFQISGGVSYLQEGNAAVDINDPSSIDVPSVNPINFEVFTQDGDIEGTVYTADDTNTEITVDVYDDGSGNLVTIPGGVNVAQTIRIFFIPSIFPQVFRLIHGQVVYANMTEAFNDLDFYSPVIPDRVGKASIDCGGIIVRKGGNDFTDTGTAGDIIYFKSKQAGGGAGGSGIAQNFQQVYLNSATQPQVIINATQGAVQVQDGTNVLTQLIFEILSFAGEQCLRVSGAGVNTATGLEKGITGIADMTGPIVINGLTDVDVPAGNGYIVDYYTDYTNGDITPVTWTAQTIAIPNLGGDAFTILYVDNAGVIQTTNSVLTPTQQRERIILGETINNTTASQILFVINSPRPINATSQSFLDASEFKGPSYEGGTVDQTQDVGTNGALSLSITAMDVFQLGINWHTSKSNPNIITYPATDPSTWTELLQDGTVVDVAETLLSGVLFDDGTSTPAIVPTDGGGRRTTIQYIFKLINGELFIQLGQTVYTDLTIAGAALDEDIKSFVVFPGLDISGRPLAAILITQNATDIADPTQVDIVNFNFGGGSGAGGGGSTTFKGLSDTADDAGVQNTAITWDSSGNLQNTGLTHSETASCWFLNGANIGGTGSLALGFFTNNASSNTTGSTMVGNNCCANLGDSNNNITVVGRGALNSVVGAAALQNITSIGASNLSSLVGGSAIQAIGFNVGASLTAATNVNLIGHAAGSAMTSATEVGIYGSFISGPTGVVSDYVNIHQFIQINTADGTLVLGGPNNTLPSDSERSLVLASTDQVMNVNVLAQAEEDALAGGVDGDFWFNSDLGKYRGRGEFGETNSFVTGFPRGYIYWPNAFARNGASGVRIFSPLSCRDDLDVYDFNVTANTDISLLTDGVLGVNTNQFPALADQFYNIRLLADSNGVNPDSAEIIELGTTPALPAGYDITATLFPPVLTNNLVQVISVQPIVLGQSMRMYHFLSEANSLILSDGPATVRTDVDLSALVPAGVQVEVHINVGFATGAGGSAGDGVGINSSATVTEGQNSTVQPGFVSATKQRQNMSLTTDPGAIIQYINDNAANRTDIYVTGYTMAMRQEV